MNLRQFVELINGYKELVAVGEKLSPVHEIPAALKEFDRYGGYAGLFENVIGFDVPVVGNLFSKRSRIEKLFNTDDIIKYCLESMKKPVSPVIRKEGESQERTCINEIDVSRMIPALTHHEGDAGPYITSATVIAKDPLHGNYRMGIHRIQVKGKDKLGIFLASPPLSIYYENAKKMGKPLEVAIVIGPDPEVFFSSVVWAPQGYDKLALAGGLAQKPIELLKGLTIDLTVPASAEFVLEGHIVPDVLETEGPFGEESGVYHSTQNPIVKLTAITSKTKPMYQALMPFTNEGRTLMSVAWELSYYESAKKSFPNILSVRVYPFDWTAITVQMRKKTDQDPKMVIEYFFKTSPYIKTVVVVDDDIDPLDPQDITWAISSRCQPSVDVIIKDGFPASMIDPSRKDEHITSKIGIDATIPSSTGNNDRYKKISIPSGILGKVHTLCLDKLERLRNQR